MITAIVAFYEASRDQTSPPSMTNCSIVNVLSLCCSGESKKYNFDSAQAFLPGETEGSYQTLWENVKSRKRWRITAKHGWEETHSVVWPSHTLPHALSSFLCASMDSSTPHVLSSLYVHPWTAALHMHSAVYMCIRGLQHSMKYWRPSKQHTNPKKPKQLQY